MVRGNNRHQKASATSAMAVLLLAGCGPAPGSATPAPATTPLTPTTLTAPPPTRVTTRDRTVPPPSAPCPRTATDPEPFQSCTLTMHTGETTEVLLRTPYPKAAFWRIQEIGGTSVHVGSVEIDSEGSARFALTAVRPGGTRISAYVPGPHSAPGRSLTLSVTVPD